MRGQVVSDSIQVPGGHGLMAHSLEKRLWEAKLLQILEGANQIQRVLAARALPAGGRQAPVET